MIVTSPEPNSPLASALVSIRPAGTPPVSTSLPQQLTAVPPPLPTSGAPAPAAVSVDPLPALLQSTTNTQQTPVASAELARRYAESGSLTQRAASAAMAPQDAANSRQVSGAGQPVADPSQAFRQPATTSPLPQLANVPRELANAQLPNAPSTAGNAPTVIVVDGRTIQLTPAQAALVRSQLAAGFRKVGPGIAGQDAEDPTVRQLPHDGSSSTRQREVTAVDTISPRLGDAPERRARPMHDDLPHIGENRFERVEAVRALRHGEPAPYEPQLIVGQPLEQAIVAPGPDRVLLAGQQTEEQQRAAITGIAVALAPGITRDDVTTEVHPDGYLLSCRGSDDRVLLRARDDVTVQLVFADGSTLRLQLRHD